VLLACTRLPVTHDPTVQRDAQRAARLGRGNGDQRRAPRKTGATLPQCHCASPSGNRHRPPGRYR
jgi:hypothetical protein